MPAYIIDTAGLRESADTVERLGIQRTWEQIERADVVLAIADSSVGDTAADQEILQRLPPGIPRLRVMNKIDLTGQPTARVDQQEGSPRIWISAKNRGGNRPAP